jgi:hypothetical protein
MRGKEIGQVGRKGGEKIGGKGGKGGEREREREKSQIDTSTFHSSLRL